MDDSPIVGLTMGDPAGVGSEIIVKAYPELAAMARIIVIGDQTVMDATLDNCDSDLSLDVVDSVSTASFGDDAISMLNLDLVNDVDFGVVREEYGEASLAYVERAIALAQSGAIDAITTAPINKQSTRLAGSTHAGHTGLLANRTDTENYTMMLIHDHLRVTHVSTHVPLREACELVTKSRVLDTIRVTEKGLIDLGVDRPRIAVAGLNPHASDGGLLGDTEETAIRPAIEAAQAEGIDAIGPESPDTIFSRAADGLVDCVVSMYHDQGHIPIKMLGFAEGRIAGVNMTVGLPIIRTSVDHGTAFDIAGQCIADPGSLVDAVFIAVTAAD